jgi:hypothetical protein
MTDLTISSDIKSNLSALSFQLTAGSEKYNKLLQQLANSGNAGEQALMEFYSNAGQTHLPGLKAKLIKSSTLPILPLRESFFRPIFPPELYLCTQSAALTTSSCNRCLAPKTFKLQIA